MVARAIENRRPGLDVVRCVAILLVMLHHFRGFKGSPEWFSWFAMRGYIGVDLFFVLSGWLIGGQLLRKYRAVGRVEPMRFWFRRWARTIPPYVIMIALLVSLGMLPFGKVPVYLLFLQNYTGDVATWLISWSLCVEEHFYLLLPVVFLAIAKIRRRWVVGIIVTMLIIGPPLMRWHALSGMNAKIGYWKFLVDYYSVTHLRLDGLAIGVTLAALNEYKTDFWQLMRRHDKVVAIIGVVIIVLFTWNPWVTGHSGGGGERMKFLPWVVCFLMVGIGTGLTLPFANRWESTSYFLSPIIFCSDHAYSLYLTHDLCKHFVSKWCKGAPFWACVLLAFSSSIASSALLRFIVEVPSLRFRDWVLSRPRVGQTVR